MVHMDISIISYYFKHSANNEGMFQNYLWFNLKTTLHKDKQNSSWNLRIILSNLVLAPVIEIKMNLVVK